jgi:hypothetical protein
MAWGGDADRFGRRTAQATHQGPPPTDFIRG